MLTPEQVIPSLLHEEARVREHAVEYLWRAHDPSPATADDFWAAIDRLGMGAGREMLSHLDDLPQTASSLERAIIALRETEDEDRAYWLQRVLQRAALALLEPRLDEVLGLERLHPALKDHLRQRLELAGLPLEELWRRLMEEAARWESEDSRDLDEQGPDSGALLRERLVEAVARHPEAAAKALETLQGEVTGTAGEVLAARVLGAIRHAPAAPRLIDLLLIDADDLRDEVCKALTAIGTIEVVERLAAFIPGQRWDVRLYADDPLERIRRPESEAALLRLLRIEKSKDIRGNLARAICWQCPGPEVLQIIRDEFAAGRLESDFMDLEEMILAAGAMTGYTPPDAKRWRAELEHLERQRERDGERELTIQEMLLRLEQRMPGRAKGRPSVRVPDLQKRHDPKIGRNEPCPCGSGRKYKKCCLRNAAAMG